jgi:DNA-directed RNA polymerase specialized sigma24 family protein
MHGPAATPSAAVDGVTFRLTKRWRVFPDRRTDIVALDDALRALADIDPRKSRMIEMRFLGGLSAKETAEVLNVSPETVLRDWRLANPHISQGLFDECRNEPARFFHSPWVSFRFLCRVQGALALP